MSDYPPEVQAVLDAAEAIVTNYPSRVSPRLREAVAAYRKTAAPPEPFETSFNIGDEVWLCTVTPVERVQ